MGLEASVPLDCFYPYGEAELAKLAEPTHINFYCRVSKVRL